MFPKIQRHVKKIFSVYYVCRQGTLFDVVGFQRRFHENKFNWWCIFNAFVSTCAVACTLPIVISFDPIVVSDNKRCSILVRLVSSNWSIVGMGIPLAVFIPKIDKWWYWCIIRLSFEIMVKCSLISYNFLLFARNFSILLLTFTSIFSLVFGSIVMLEIILLFASIFLEWGIPIFLMIFFSPIFFLLWCYNITIDGNVCNVFEM